MTMDEFETLNLIKYLEGIRGRHTELVTVYVPAGFNLDIIRGQLSEEKNTASNIKDRNNRKNVVDALEKISNELRLIRLTPVNGLIVFCGNVSEREGEPDIKIWDVEPPQKSDIRLYRCDQHFIIEPLKAMYRQGNAYGLIVLDNREATFGVLEGANITALKHIKSLVPGKFSKGGQSAQRFAREREGLIRDFYKEIANTAKSLFFEENLSGILVGGPGPAKENFLDSGYLVTDLKKRVKGIKSISYTDESGLKELVEKSKDVLANERAFIEKELVQKVMASIARNDNLSAYGEMAVRKEIAANNVELLLLSSGLEDTIKNEFYYAAKKGDVRVEFISKESSDGAQLYSLGGVAAILRRPSK
ncbi:MAG: peptide chain release factor aRF-1 [Candidatus Parvarchaeota archaeon]|nr:peptide chain release factor aRF-1 [Candidatus Parvarchaeota archaeon]